MKYFLLILFISCIAFSSCNGRTTKQKALKESISNFKNTIKPIEIVEYLPEMYAEIQTDTTLSNGYRVKIKNFTSMTKAVLKPTISKSTSSKTYFRQIESEITVYKNDKLILETVFNDDFFQNHITNDINFKNYLNNGIRIDEMASLKKDILVLSTSYFKPEDDIEASYKIIIDESGNCQFKKTDYART